MKKKFLLASCLLFLIFTTAGCSSGGSDLSSGSFGKTIMQRSGIGSDKSYEEYTKELAAGHIRNNYYYDENSPVEISGQEHHISSDKACISVSENRFLNVHYFLDPEHEFEISGISQSFIYLEPGETIYAEAERSDSASASHEFSEFRVFDITGGKNSLISSGYDQNTGMVFTVPENGGGMEFRIEPAGRYEKKSINLSDYYTDDTFQRIETDGRWLVNGTECTGEKALVSSTGSYSVSYEYNSDEYFFVSSEPKYCFKEDGKIQFSRVSASDDISDFSVEIHPFLSTVLSAESNAKAEINGAAAGSFQKGQQISLSHLKFGDTVVITCSKKEDIKYDKTILSLSKADDNFGVYTFTVKEPSDDFTFNPSDYRFEHGKIEFRYLGNTITEKIGLAAGRQIEYYAVSADDGYWLPDGSNTITVSENPEETKKQLEQIRFYQKKLVTVYFPQPEAGGTITYKKNERTITNKSEKMLSGTVITMKFTPWNGWNQAVAEETFIVNDEADEQTVNVSQTDINSIFTEIKEHRPHLTVSADKQVGSGIRFSVRTADVTKNNLARDKKQTNLFDAGIGTADGITISASGKLGRDEIMKMTVEKTNQSGSKTTDIIYLDKLPSEHNIEIYTPNEKKTSEIYYTDISVKITVTEKMNYAPVSAENAAFSLRFADTTGRTLISSGEILDRDRMVTVTLKPAAGYYLTGDNITGETYQAKMKYSEFLSGAERISKSYPRKKICSLDLNTSDEYGKVLYTLNGTEVNGPTDVREEDELVMNYTLENKDYIIYKDFLSAMQALLSNSPYEKSEVIKITPDLDGSVIRREDYITVQKKEK